MVSKKKIHNWCEGEKNLAHQIKIFVVFTHVSNICVSDRGKNKKKYAHDYLRLFWSQIPRC